VEPGRLADRVAALLADGLVIGLMQGRMEFGRAALGGRSIIGDARSPKMQSVMNLKIKYRESFRPFAPAVLREHVADWFELERDSPYMLLVAGRHRAPPEAVTPEQDALWGIEKLNVPRSEIRRWTHVDYSARVQTVRREANPLFYDILAAFTPAPAVTVIVKTHVVQRQGASRSSARPRMRYRCFRRTAMERARARIVRAAQGRAAGGRRERGVAGRVRA